MNLCQSNCGFLYDASLTASVTSISPASGSLGSSLTITGSGFGTVKENVIVSIGDILCTIQTVADSSITCTVGEVAGGR